MYQFGLKKPGTNKSGRDDPKYYYLELLYCYIAYNSLFTDYVSFHYEDVCDLRPCVRKLMLLLSF